MTLRATYDVKASVERRYSWSYSENADSSYWRLLQLVFNFNAFVSIIIDRRHMVAKLCNGFTPPYIYSTSLHTICDLRCSSNPLRTFSMTEHIASGNIELENTAGSPALSENPTGMYLKLSSRDRQGGLPSPSLSLYPTSQGHYRPCGQNQSGSKICNRSCN